MGLLSSIGSALGLGGGSDAPQIQFNPWNVNSGMGSATFEDGSVDATLSPELQGVSNNLLGMLQNSFGQAQNNPYSAPSQMQQTQFNPMSSLAATQGLLGQMMNPEFERQRQSQESRLLNQGLLGSTTGALQQQGLSKAQNQAMLNATLGAQNQFFGQQMQNNQYNAGIQNQNFGQFLGMENFNNQNLQGLLGSYLNLQQMPLQLAGLGGQLGGQQMDADSFNAQAQMQADANQSGFFGNLLGGAVSGFMGGAGGEALGGWMFGK